MPRSVPSDGPSTSTGASDGPSSTKCSATGSVGLLGFPAVVTGSLAPEAVDGGEVLCAFVGVADAEAFGGGEGEHADLALVAVAVHVVGGLADLVEGVDLGQGGVDEAAVDEPVGLPGLAVVGEVGADDPFEV